MTRGGEKYIVVMERLRSRFTKRRSPSAEQLGFHQFNLKPRLDMIDATIGRLNEPHVKMETEQDNSVIDYPHHIHLHL